MSETDSMIERVALVLYGERMRVWKAVAPAELLDRAVTWEGESDSYREQVRREARLSIEAMRQPTTEMYEAGQNEVSHFDGEFGDYNVYFSAQQIDRLWPAMIDAALNPPANT